MPEHYYRCVICGANKTITVGSYAFYTVPYCKWCVTTMHLVPADAQPYRIDEADNEE
jgi:hypothetical protein